MAGQETVTRLTPRGGPPPGDVLPAHNNLAKRTRPRILASETTGASAVTHIQGLGELPSR